MEWELFTGLLRNIIIATEKYNSLMNLLKLQGCNDIENVNVAKNASYNSVQTANDFRSVIAECIQDEITD